MMTEQERLASVRARLTGFTGHCGIEIETVETGRCTAVCRTGEEHLNPLGLVHGGVTATLMDVAAGTAAIYAVDPPRYVVTQSADVHYLRPAGPGLLRAEARAVKAGRHTCFTQVQVSDEAGRLVASGSFEIFYVDAG